MCWAGDPCTWSVVRTPAGTGCNTRIAARLRNDPRSPMRTTGVQAVRVDVPRAFRLTGAGRGQRTCCMPASQMPSTSCCCRRRSGRRFPPALFPFPEVRRQAVAAPDLNEGWPDIPDRIHAGHIYGIELKRQRSGRLSLHAGGPHSARCAA